MQIAGPSGTEGLATGTRSLEAPLRVDSREAVRIGVDVTLHMILPESLTCSALVVCGIPAAGAVECHC